MILWRHDAEAMWVAMGSVINALLSNQLKQIFNHQRPNPSLRSDPGMPSSHAQSIFYAASYVVISRKFHQTFVLQSHYGYLDLSVACCITISVMILSVWCFWSTSAMYEGLQMAQILNVRIVKNLMHPRNFYS